MSGNKTLTTFIEANDITVTMSGTMQGDGPTDERHRLVRPAATSSSPS